MCIFTFLTITSPFFAFITISGNSSYRTGELVAKIKCSSDNFAIVLFNVSMRISKNFLIGTWSEKSAVVIMFNSELFDLKNVIS